MTHLRSRAGWMVLAALFTVVSTGAAEAQQRTGSVPEELAERFFFLGTPDFDDYQVVDQDGDGRLELVALSEGKLRLWRQVDVATHFDFDREQEGVVIDDAGFPLRLDTGFGLGHRFVAGIDGVAADFHGNGFGSLRPFAYLGNGDFSISFWAKPHSWEGTVVGTHGCRGQNEGWMVRLGYYGEIRFRGYSDFRDQYADHDWVGVQMDGTGVWHHYAVQRESGVLRLYVDAVEQAAKESRRYMGGVCPLWVGSDMGHPYTAQQVTAGYHGLLDELRIEDRALTSTELAALVALRDWMLPGEPVNTGLGLVLHMPFEDSVVDVIQPGRPIDAPVNVTFGPGIAGSRAAVFDGSSSRVHIPHPDSTKPHVADWAFADGDYTISFWADAYSWEHATYDAPLSNYACPPDRNYEGWFLTFGYDGQAIFNSHEPGATDPSANDSVRHTFDGSTGGFHHYVIHKRRGATRFFVDGVEVDSRMSMLPTGSGCGLMIGDFDPPSNPFHGSIDELRIYDRALNLLEVQALCNAGPAAPCPGP